MVPRDRKRTISWILAGLFTVATFSVWLYAIFIYDPGLLVDELADRTFPKAAESVCAATLAELDQLPRAEETDDPVQRADVIDEANAMLTQMVDRLHFLAPDHPREASEAINEWLGDWKVHIHSRQEYADKLRTDPNAEFIETTKGSKQLSRAIDGYAQVNRMNSCQTPGDVG